MVKPSTPKPAAGGAGGWLLGMARQAERLLAQHETVLNALNVFPVPDGDTGSNMLSTIREALRRAEGCPPAEIPGALAAGALLGARGNSGVILSQVFRAQAEVLGDSASLRRLTVAGLRATLARARELAYGIVANPAEGTMLSVLSAMSAAAPAMGDGAAAGVSWRGELAEAVAGLIQRAERALAVTPDQLPILREAGVVDAGGYGLVLLLRGWYEALSGRPADRAADDLLLGLPRAREQAASGHARPASLLPDVAQAYGYCVTLLVENPTAVEQEVRGRLCELGSSVLVVTEGNHMKMHAHLLDPAPALALASSIGTLLQTDVTSIDEQTEPPGGPAIPVVAVAAGDGLVRLFRRLGATPVAGGQSRNPSTAEIVAACEQIDGVAYVLPNNPNVIAAANQAAGARPNIVVVPTRSVPQGVAAALACDGEGSVEDNAARMIRAARGVLSAELVGAVRDATLAGIEVRTGQTMVLLDGELLGIEQGGIAALLARVRDAGCELATIYTGQGATQAEAQRLREALLAELPAMHVDMVTGDQPSARFLVGFE